MPFCTTSWAALTAWATPGLASKVCGSVLGLLSIAVTWTYLPPIWPITLAYWFSAPTAVTTWPPGASLEAELAEHAVASSPAMITSAAARLLRRGGTVGLLRVSGFTANTNENGNQYRQGAQPVRGSAGLLAGSR